MSVILIGIFYFILATQAYHYALGAEEIHYWLTFFLFFVCFLPGGRSSRRCIFILAPFDDGRDNLTAFFFLLFFDASMGFLTHCQLR